MNNKQIILTFGYLSSIIFFGIYFTKNMTLLGILAGYVTGWINIVWLFRDARKALDQELQVALRIYYRSLFSRLGLVTLVVATVARYRHDWLFYLALGIAVGIIIPLISAIRQQFKQGRG